MLEIKGYKGFTLNMENEPGDKFEVGKTYTTIDKGPLKFGPSGNGFHFCKSLEDCFIYFKPETSIFTEVTGLVEVRETDDTYNDIYGICVARSIRIDRLLTNEEIVEMYLNPENGLGPFVLKRFLQLYKLNDTEILEFKKKNYNDFYTLQDIMYYQENEKDVYSNREKVFTYQKLLKKKYESSSE